MLIFKSRIWIFQKITGEGLFRGEHFMKRGQAALEFLTTYGWAFLVILVMIGALAYFGVLSPKNLLPPRCIFSPEIDCLEAQIIQSNVNGNAEVDFRFRNNVGSTAYFAGNITFLGGNNPQSTNCTGDIVNAVGAVQIPPGRVSAVTCEFSTTAATLPKEDKAKFEVTMYVKKADGSYWNPIKGEIYGTVN
jgi:hypothetical protein